MVTTVLRATEQGLIARYYIEWIHRIGHFDPLPQATVRRIAFNTA